MEILNTYVSQDISWWILPVLFFFINVMGIGISLLFDEEWYVGLIIGTIFFCIIFGLMCVGGAFQQYTICEARIDDSISFKDIYENYEVISQRGNIYILKELIK